MARPPHRSPPRAPAAAPAAAPVDAEPLAEADIERMQALLDAVPAPLEPLDVSMLDGFLCAVVVQPQPVPAGRWLPHVIDIDGRAPSSGAVLAELHELVLRRHAELASAIAGRRWFDPWVFEMGAESEGEEEADAVRAAVYPWVAGFATAFELFPALSQAPADGLREPLALLYRHLDPDDLDDDASLQDEIDGLEPAADLADAVEGLVRATLLLADLAGPAAPPRPTLRPTRRHSPRR